MKEIQENMVIILSLIQKEFLLMILMTEGMC